MTVWQDDAARDLVLNAGDRLAMLVRGEGSYLWDADGRRHLDFLAGIAVTSLGHAHPTFVEAVSTQAATLAHVSNYFATPPQLALAARLKRLAGAGIDGRVFFSNSVPRRTRPRSSSPDCTAVPSARASSRWRTASTAAPWDRWR